MVTGEADNGHRASEVGRRPRSQPGVDWLGLEGEHAEHALVHPPQRLAPGHPVEASGRYPYPVSITRVPVTSVMSSTDGSRRLPLGNA